METMQHEVTIPPELDGQRLDRALVTDESQGRGDGGLGGEGLGLAEHGDQVRDQLLVAKEEQQKP